LCLQSAFLQLVSKHETKFPNSTSYFSDQNERISNNNRKTKKKYEVKIAAENLSLQIAKGELFGLLGPNRAEKTTLISILCGLIKPTSDAAQNLRLRYPKRHPESQRDIGVWHSALRKILQNLIIHPSFF
jgi:ABC-type multidrug transport system ATPase subunit